MHRGISIARRRKLWTKLAVGLFVPELLLPLIGNKDQFAPPSVIRSGILNLH